jgi:hypothetical protein
MAENPEGWRRRPSENVRRKRDWDARKFVKKATPDDDFIPEETFRGSRPPKDERTYGNRSTTEKSSMAGEDYMDTMGFLEPRPVVPRTPRAKTKSVKRKDGGVGNFAVTHLREEYDAEQAKRVPRPDSRAEGPARERPPAIPPGPRAVRSRGERISPTLRCRRGGWFENQHPVEIRGCYEFVLPGEDLRDFETVLRFPRYADVEYDQYDVFDWDMGGEDSDVPSWLAAAGLTPDQYRQMLDDEREAEERRSEQLQAARGAELLEADWRRELALRHDDSTETCQNPNGCSGTIKAKDRCGACYEYRRSHKGAERPARDINRARGRQGD